MPPRLLQPELMDDPALPAGDHRAALAQLARLNRISRTAAALWARIRVHGASKRVLTVLDVATGSGDVPAALAALARRDGVAVRLEACDVSPVALEAARTRWRESNVVADLRLRDVVRAGLPHADASIDVVTCSLFLHHLEEADAVRVLGEMARVAGRLVLVSDLRRCRAGLAAAWLATRVATTSRVVRVDAIRSVRAAFTERELAAMATRAGMPGARIRRSWPFRMLLVWERTGHTSPTPSSGTSPGTPS